MAAKELDLDTVSLTSTVESEPQEQYDINKILAQWVIDGEIEYLVSWKGYEEHRNTWEPPSSFNDSKTVRNWQRRRRDSSPFDVKAWEDRQTVLWNDRNRRKKARKMKRREAGLDVSSSDESWNQNFTDNEHTTLNPDIHRNDDEDLVHQSEPQTSSTITGSTTPAGFHGPYPPQLGKVGSGPLRQPSKETAKRTGMDVAANWDATPTQRQRNLLSGKPYKNLSHRHNAQKRGNTEPAPNVEALDLYDPKTRKPSHRMWQTSQPSPAIPVDSNSKKTAFPPVGEGIAARAAAGLQIDFPAPDTIGTGTPITLETQQALSNRCMRHSLASGSQPPPDLSDSMAPLSVQHQVSPMHPAGVPIAPRAQLAWKTVHPGQGPLSTHPIAGQWVHPDGQFPFSRSIPSPEEKRAMMEVYQSNLVIGRMFTDCGELQRDLGKVKLCGLDRELKRQLLSLKTPDGRLDFRFKVIYGGSEYVRHLQAPLVSLQQSMI